MAPSVVCRGGSGIEEIDGVSIDHSKGMLQQVGMLGHRYDAWTHKPLTGAPRYFDSDFLELFSKNPWWVVPIVWIPVIVSAAIYSVLRMEPTAWLCHVFSGVLTWQLIEYSLHRFLFHMEARSPAFIVFHFTMHGAHHKYPMDKDRLVFPPVPASGIAVVVLAGLYAALGQVTTCLATGVGAAIGYLAYDMIHYWCHHARSLPSFLERQKRVHMAHHYKNHDVSFGISSPLFDYVFGTLPAAEKSD